MDVDFILTGNPTTKDLVEFFKAGYDEEYVVAAIKKHLRTEAQRQKMFEFDLSIEDILNGRFGIEAHDGFVSKMFTDWNKKLGTKVFGY
jgi:hypothetical protein